MCGIVGMAGNLNTKEREIFKDLLTSCQVRGRDATGAFSVGADNSVGWSKTVGTPDRLFELKSWDRAVDRFNAKILVGHCRAKTIGENIHANAHPFDHDNVIGVHNGTLDYTWRRNQSADGFKVDSDWLISEISSRGVEQVIPEIAGAWTLNWWDRRNNTINFLRNEERPLHFAWSADKKIMFWASEPWMLYGIVGRSIKLAELEPGVLTCRLAENELWSFEVSKVGDFKATPPRRIEGGPRVANFTMGGNHSNQYYRRPAWEPSSTASTKRGGSGVTGPFQEGTPGYLLESLQTRVDAARKVVPGLPAPVIDHSKLPSKQTSEPKLTLVTSDSSTTASPTPSASQTGSSSTRPWSKRQVSRPVLGLRNSLTTSSDGQSSERMQHYRSGSKNLSPFIDLRKVGSIWYITDRKTGREYSEITFDSNTNRCCAWCQSRDHDLKDVHEFIDEWNFICNECDKDVAANA